MPNSYNSTYTGGQHDTYVLKQDLIDLIYPIGAVYISVNSTNPGTLFGGTWEQIQDTFLLCAGSTYAAGTTGGAASVTSSGTALTIAQIPSHAHSISAYKSSSEAAGYGIAQTSGFKDRVMVTGSSTSGFAGSGQAHTHTVSTIPPYLSVYVWKRTA